MGGAKKGQKGRKLSPEAIVEPSMEVLSVSCGEDLQGFMKKVLESMSLP